VQVCPRPKLDLEHDVIKGAFHPVAPLRCLKKPLFYIEDGAIHVNQSVVKGKKIEKCVYKAVERMVDSMHVYSKSHTRYQEPFDLKIKHDFFRVQCFVSDVNTGRELKQVQNRDYNNMHPMPVNSDDSGVHRQAGLDPGSQGNLNLANADDGQGGQGQPRLGVRSGNTGDVGPRGRTHPDSLNHMYEFKAQEENNNGGRIKQAMLNVAEPRLLNRRADNLAGGAQNMRPAAQGNQRQDIGHVGGQAQLNAPQKDGGVQQSHFWGVGKRKPGINEDGLKHEGGVNTRPQGGNLLNPFGRDENQLDVAGRQGVGLHQKIIKGKTGMQRDNTVGGNQIGVNHGASVDGNQFGMNSGAKHEQVPNLDNRLNPIPNVQNAAAQPMDTNNQVKPNIPNRYVEKVQAPVQPNDNKPAPFQPSDKLNGPAQSVNMNKPINPTPEAPVQPVNKKDQVSSMGNAQPAQPAHVEQITKPPVHVGDEDSEEYDNEPDYDQFFAQIHPRKEVFERINELHPKDGAKRMNVLMVIIDSLSHMSWKRKLPQTYRFLKNSLGSTILDGYNIIGDGTTPNIIALLAGNEICSFNGVLFSSNSSMFQIRISIDFQYYS
jgi:hypothetical protein